MKPAEYAAFMTARVGEAIVESWQNRRPGKVGWGQGQAAVAQNRRAVHADGTAQMYGPTNTQEFRGIEGYEDEARSCRRLLRGFRSDGSAGAHRQMIR